MGHVTPRLRQESARISRDNGSETGATWFADLNTDYETSQTNLKFRLRFLIQEIAGGSVGNFVEELRYSVNGGAWTLLEASGDKVRSAGTIYYNSDDHTTTGARRLGSGTYLADNKACRESTGYGATDKPDFAGNDEFECEFMCQLHTGTIEPGDDLEFKIRYDGNADLDEYNADSIVTVSLAGETPGPPGDSLYSLSLTGAGK